MKSAKQQVIDNITEYLRQLGKPTLTIEDPQTPNLQVPFDVYVDRFAKFRSELTFQLIFEDIKKYNPLPT